MMWFEFTFYFHPEVLIFFKQIANSLPKKLSKCSHDVKMDFSLLINKYKRDLNSGKQVIEMWNTDSLV